MNLYQGIAVIAAILQFATAKKTISEKMTLIDEVVHEARSYCEYANGVTEIEAAKVTKRDMAETYITQEMKCYWECFFKKIGYMDDDGNINEKPINLKPTPCYVKYGYPCLNVTGIDNCDKAANFVKCFHKTTEEDADGPCRD